MKQLASVLAVSACVVLAPDMFLVRPLAAPGRRAVARDRQGTSWENSRLRVTEVSVGPGASLPADGNQLIVHLTADADGRMPAEAVWRTAGSAALQNRGPARLDAIVIDLKGAPRGDRPGTPPEAVDAQYGVEVTPLVDNAQVLVTKHRFGPLAYGGPLHAHDDDVLVVYLSSGYTWPTHAFWGASRVRRGDIEVIPANTFHRLGNASSDPLELLIVVSR